MNPAIFKTIADSHEALVLATILDVKGSSPRHAGTKMLFGERSGRIGTIGGGQSEARALAACRQCLADRVPQRLETKMIGAGTASTEMICGGVNRILIEAIPAIEPYRQAVERLAKGERVVFIKRFIGEADKLVSVNLTLLDRHGNAIHGAVSESERPFAEHALNSGKPRFDEQSNTYYEPAFPEEKLLILGGGHVGRALANAASTLDFQVTVVDDRPEILADANLPAKVQTIIADYEKAMAEFPFDSATYVVIVTRGHALDLACLRILLTREYRYAGLMGSIRKTRLLASEAIKEGFDPVKIDALCAPIGLDIGAETPEELALSILSEIVAFKRNARILPPLKQARKARWTVT